MWSAKLEKYAREIEERAERKRLKTAERQRLRELKEAPLRAARKAKLAIRRREQRRKQREKEKRRKNWELYRRIEWAKANPTRARLLSKSYGHAQRVKIHQDEPNWKPDDIDALMIKQRGKCANRFCKYPWLDTFEIDHIVPIAMNGTNAARNIQLLCYDCNRRKGTRTMSDFMDMCESLADV